MNIITTPCFLAESRGRRLYIYCIREICMNMAFRFSLGCGIVITKPCKRKVSGPRLPSLINVNKGEIAWVFSKSQWGFGCLYACGKQILSMKACRNFLASVTTLDPSAWTSMQQSLHVCLSSPYYAQINENGGSTKAIDKPLELIKKTVMFWDPV